MLSVSIVWSDFVLFCFFVQMFPILEQKCVVKYNLPAIQFETSILRIEIASGFIKFCFVLHVRFTE